MKPWILDFFLKRLPTPENVRVSWLYRFFGPSLMRLDHWLPSRHSLALGIGLGWFIGLLPIFGLRHGLGLMAGALLRCHLPAVIFGTMISNPFTMPGILALQYFAGRWMCSLVGLHVHLGIPEKSLVLQHLVPLMMGGAATAIPAGLLGYAGVWLWLGWRGKSIAGWVV